MVLPSDHRQQAQEEVARLREGAKTIKKLKRWRSPILKATYDEQVLVFGTLLLVQVQDAWMLFERSGKVLWHKYHHKDLFALYEVVIHLSLLCDWTQFEELPLPERIGIEWRLTELTWSTGQSMSWELFAMMFFDLARAAEASNAMSQSPL